MKGTRWALTGCAVFAVLGCAVIVVVALWVLRVPGDAGGGPSGVAGGTGGSAGGAGGGAPVLTAESELERGVGLMGQFNFEEAERAFSNAQGLHPGGWWLATLDRAVAMLNMTAPGSQERAIQELQPLLSVPQAKTRAQYLTALAELYLGNPAKAKPLFEAALAETNGGADANGDAYAAFYVAQCTELLGDYAGARKLYETAVARDPMLRSSYLGLQRTADRLGQPDAAADALKRFQELGDDLRSTLAEFKYTRMGPLSEAIVDDALAGGDSAAARVLAQPSGRRPCFGPSQKMAISGLLGDRAVLDLSPPTTADLNGDGFQDLIWTPVIPGIRGLVLMGSAGGAWRSDDSQHIAGVQADGVLWADLDNDGRVDAVINCDDDSAYALLQREPAWERIALAGDRELFEALLAADLDQDGDVDLVVNEDGPPLLLLNRGDATFEVRELADPTDAEDGWWTDRATAGDFDSDGDIDLAVVRDDDTEWRLQVWLAQPPWTWTRAPEMEPKSSVTDCVFVPAYGGAGPQLACLVSDSSRGDREAGDPTGVEVWALSSPPRRQAKAQFADLSTLTVCDVDGSGVPSLVAVCGPGQPAIHVMDMGCNPIQDIAATQEHLLLQADPLVLDGSGLQIVVSDSGSASRAPAVIPAGPARQPIAAVNFRGRTDPSQQMRTNASGIGAQFAARVGGRWVTGASLPMTAGGITKSQSLQPNVIGLAGASAASFIRVRWPDGVLQTELDIKPGLRTIVETQRQISSCPVIFAWDGGKFRFQTDCLGVGGMGYLVGAERQQDGCIKPVYAPPRPWERVLLGEPLELRDGAYEIRLGEPMEEACYLDAARLVAYDVPDGWSLALDERMGINGPLPTGQPLMYRRSMVPVKAVATTDATSAVAAQDGIAADLGPADRRFIGLLARPGALELHFPNPVTSHAGHPVLLIDGWVEYPYCQTNFAMWQAGVPYQAPTLEALDPATQQWVTLVAEYGYPAGMPRQCVLPIPADKLPAGCDTLRLRTTMEIYFERIQLAWAEPCPQLRRTEIPLQTAACAFAGFPQRITHAQRRPDYDYARRAPLWDCRMQYGSYTAYGPCTELVAATDDAVAIFGAGEELRLRFAPDARPDGGARRTWVLELDGWCKDMDRYTGQGAQLEPLPVRELNASHPRRTPQELARTAALHARFNTRIAGGN